MTKSEARAIQEATGRALRILYGTQEPSAVPYLDMPTELRDKVYASIKVACDEIDRVAAMASAELGGK